ncbi:hypothetical protein, partial [Methylorubrum aminovorans]
PPPSSDLHPIQLDREFFNKIGAQLNKGNAKSCPFQTATTARPAGPPLRTNRSPPRPPARSTGPPRAAAGRDRTASALVGGYAALSSYTNLGGQLTVFSLPNN